MSQAASVLIRPAQATDMGKIRQLVLFAKLDLTQLRWQQFLVAEIDERVIACGQLREFADAQELGSLVVEKQCRKKGLGQLLTQKLIEKATKPIYLECLGQQLVTFYTKSGFIPVKYPDLPPSLQGKYKLTHWAKNTINLPATFMHFPNPCHQ